MRQILSYPLRRNHWLTRLWQRRLVRGSKYLTCVYARNSPEPRGCTCTSTRGCVRVSARLTTWTSRETAQWLSVVVVLFSSLSSPSSSSRSSSKASRWRAEEDAWHTGKLSMPFLAPRTPKRSFPRKSASSSRGVRSRY